MIVRRLRVQRFACLDDFAVTFGPGLNVVYGPNESGKSTLQRALLKALVDRPAQRKANEEDRRWGEKDLYRLELEFEAAGGQVWTLSKDYQHNRVRLSGDGGERGGWEEIQAVLSAALGTASAQMLRSTCCIAQDELSAITDGRKQLCESLESLVTGGDDDSCSSDAIAQLDKAILGLRRGLGTRTAANPGQLADLAERRAGLEARAAGLRSALAEEERVREQLAGIRAQLAAVDTALPPRIAAHAAADRAFGLLQQLADAKATEGALAASLQRIAETEGLIQQIESALTDPANLAPAEAECRELTRLHERIGLLRAHLAETGTLADGAGLAATAWPARWKELAGSTGPRALALLVSISAGILVPRAGPSLGLSPAAANVLSGLSILLDAALAISLARSITTWVRAARASSRPGRQHGDVALPGMLAGLNQDASALEYRLRALGCSDWQALEARCEAGRSLRAKSHEARARLEGLLAQGTSREDLEEARKVASARRRDLEESLAEPDCQRAVRLGPVEYQTLSHEIDRLAQEQRDLERDAIVLGARLDATRGSREDLITAEEELAAVAAELLHLEDTVAIYQLTREALQEARERTLGMAQDRLGPLAGSYLSELTGGRYPSIMVDGDLNVSVAQAVGTTTVRPERLSKGTQDQVFLAVRLALIDLLFADARPPLLLDDPFVKFDAARRTAALQICRRIASDRQVILFTCSREYADWGQPIVMPALAAAYPLDSIAPGAPG